jgi:flagellar hook-basal body complex protein FliE
VTIAAIPALARSELAAGPQQVSSGFDVSLRSALGNLTQSLGHADGLAAAVALGKGTIAEAAIARAKADVALEVAAVAAARVTGAIAALMQTQV